MDFSKLWTLNWKDFGKGLLMFVLSGIMTPVVQSAMTGNLTIEPKTIGTVAVASAAAYIGKQFATGSDGKLLSK